MAGQSVQREVWRLVRAQHGVVARRQLLEAGVTRSAIDHRLKNGRLHVVHRGVYAVGRPELTQKGRWMAAVLACGPGAVLSHLSAAVLWGIRKREGIQIEVTVPAGKNPRVPGVRVYRRLSVKTTTCNGIPVTTPTQTIVDLAPRFSIDALINEADKLDLVHPYELRKQLDHMPRQPGLAAVKDRLDRQTFNFTRSELERMFLPIARRAGLPEPQTCVEVNGFEVDFYFEELGLVVETDGGSFHRTPAQQTRDRLRDQTHAAAGLTPLRFTHAQIAYEPEHVERTLRAIASVLVETRARLLSQPPLGG